MNLATIDDVRAALPTRDRKGREYSMALECSEGPGRGQHIFYPGRKLPTFLAPGIWKITLVLSAKDEKAEPEKILSMDFAVRDEEAPGYEEPAEVVREDDFDELDEETEVSRLRSENYRLRADYFAQLNQQNTTFMQSVMQAEREARKSTEAVYKEQLAFMRQYALTPPAHAGRSSSEYWNIEDDEPPQVMPVPGGGLPPAAPGSVEALLEVLQKFAPLLEVLLGAKNNSAQPGATPGLPPEV